MTDDAAPAIDTVRKLDSPPAKEIAAYSEVFDDLQTVLRCCEWLVAALVETSDAPPAETDLLIEATWTTALLSYGRCFAVRQYASLTEADLTTTQPEGDVDSWHQILLALRDHYAHPTINPRETFSVGAAQGDDGTADGIALSSAHRPAVDLLTVRQTGAIAYGLSALVDHRIGEQEKALLEDVRVRTREELDTLDVLELVST